MHIAQGGEGVRHRWLVTKPICLKNVFRFLVCTMKFESIYPPKGTEGGPIVFTYILFCVRKRILDFQLETVFFLIGTMKMFYPPQGTLRSRRQWNPFDSFHFIVFEKRYLDLSFQGRESAF